MLRPRAAPKRPHPVVNDVLSSKLKKEPLLIQPFSATPTVKIIGKVELRRPPGSLGTQNQNATEDSGILLLTQVWSRKVRLRSGGTPRQQFRASLGLFHTGKTQPLCVPVCVCVKAYLKRNHCVCVCVCVFVTDGNLESVLHTRKSGVCPSPQVCMYVCMYVQIVSAQKRTVLLVVFSVHLRV